jgi:hypothetical protein
MKNRIYFLDHLRTFAIFLVVVVHAGLVYEWTLDSMWIVSDPVKNNNIGLIRMYLDLIVMFTIFFVSGYFIPLSVKKKNTLDFLKSKFKRILWPWLLAVFTLIPAYKFIYLYSRGLPQEEWYSYFHLFQRADSDLWLFSNDPNQNWLWFLPIICLRSSSSTWACPRSKCSWPKLTVRTGVILTVSNRCGIWHDHLRCRADRLVPLGIPGVSEGALASLLHGILAGRLVSKRERCLKRQRI